MVNLSKATVSGQIQAVDRDAAGFFGWEIGFIVDKESVALVKRPPVQLPPSEETIIRSASHLVGREDFDPSRPTVVLTHGWQPELLPIPENSYLGTGPILALNPAIIPRTYGSPSMSVFGNQMSSEIRSKFSEDVNILVYEWPEAYATIGGARKLAQGDLAEVGIRLANELALLVGESNVQPIHMIGHSFGTAVNAYAINELSVKGIRISHNTMIDAPTNDISATALGLSLPIELYANVARKVDRMENYYGGAAVGRDGVQGLGGPVPGVPNTEYRDSGHSGSWQVYKDTIMNPSLEKGGFYYSAVLGEAGGNSLLPKLGSFWDPVEFGLPLNFQSPDSFQNSLFESAHSTIMYQGSDAYITYNFEMPSEISALNFDLEFLQIGKDDWFSVLWNNESIFSAIAETYGLGERSIFVDVRSLAASQGTLAFLLSDNGPDRTELRLSNLHYTSGQFSEVSVVPLPWSGVLLGFAASLFCLFGRRRSA